MNTNSAEIEDQPAGRRFTLGERVRAHLAITRLDHATKNIFILPGIVVAYSAIGGAIPAGVAIRRILTGVIACTLIACSNYVLNELLDAPYDRHHPAKRDRPAASGRVLIRLAYVQWLLMMVAGLLLASLVSPLFTAVCAGLWAMGCVYNIPPLRTKEIPYLDVLSESVNNPLRMLMGWYMIAETEIPPVSLLIAYWMVGAYLMALKRFSEYREIGDPVRAGMYRRSFRYYTEQSLLVSVTFYASAAMLFFGAFIARYRLELILSFPFVAFAMAAYFLLSFEKGSVVQHPEYLYKEPRLMVPFGVCALVLILLMFVRIPALTSIFAPSIFAGSSVSGR